MIHEKLARVQQQVSVRKSKYNQHGKYYYRDLEDILKALAPLLKAEGLTMFMSDEVVDVGGICHLKATVTLMGDGEAISVNGWAQEATEQKGMSPAQITGCCSSYARKYALNGLFLLDDVKDDDTLSDHDDEPAEGERYPAHCRTCGKGYNFASKEQYIKWVTTYNVEHPCCDAPDWVAG